MRCDANSGMADAGCGAEQDHALLCGERRRLHDTASLPRALDRLDVMHAAAVPLRADLGAAWGGEAIDFALAPSKRWVSVPQRPHQHTASHPMFYDAACEVHHEHFSPITDRRVKRPKIDLELLDRSYLDGSVSAWVGNGLKTR